MPITQTPEMLADFLLCILDLLERHPRWGAVLKFKTTRAAAYEQRLPGGEQIVGRMRKLQEQGRLVELDLSVSTITASENSHLGVCYALNTSGIVSGLFGMPAVHWDCVGQDHPLYRDAQQKIVFKALPDMALAIEAAAAGDRTVGDLSKWRDDYNYFLDFEGDKRIAGFIQNYMEESVANEDPERTLANAVRRYQEQHGLTSAPFAQAA